MGQYDSGLTAKAGGNIEMVPEGMYNARCYQVIDLGIQPTPFFDDDGLQKNALQVRLSFEILDGLRRLDGKPFTIYREFTNSLHEKSKLLPFLEGWRGRKFTADELEGFELTKILGKYCQIQVMHETNKKGTRTYAVVANALPMNAPDKPEAVNPEVQFSLMEWDQKVFDSLGEFLQNKIRESLTYKYEVAPAGLDTSAGKEEKDNTTSDDVMDVPDDERHPDAPKLDEIIPVTDDPVNLDDIPF